VTTFALDADQQSFREVVRQIAVDRIAPRAAEIDEKAEFPWDVKEVLASNGLLGLHVPEAYGGAGADTLTWRRSPGCARPPRSSPWCRSWAACRC
jgi:alkylation response protein AidB-like acyl-CoA dehydrogenase